MSVRVDRSGMVASVWLEEGLTLEIDAMVGLTRTHDSLEGLTSFLENRPPRFEGR